MRLLLLFCLSLMAFTAPLHADDDVKKKAEVNWARGVADDFLKALENQDHANIQTLLTPEYAKLLTNLDPQKREPADIVIQKALYPRTWSITAEDISPDRDEAVFEGEFGYRDETKAKAFALRIVKGKEAGGWRICFLSVEDKKPTAEAKEPKK
jgi:hypothetical protein